MDLNWLDDLLSLAEAGNFSRAADARHMTQPAFSRRIRALEDWAGVALFDRATQPVRLTAAGERFLPVARDILRHLARGREEARQAEQAETATIAFAATQALSLTFFPGWLRGLEIAARLGAIRLMSGSMAAGEEALLQGQCQLLLCHGGDDAVSRLPRERFMHHVLAADWLLPVRAAGADHSLATAAAPCLAYAEESGLGRIVAAMLRARGKVPALNPVFISPLATVLQAMARDGRGLAWLPQSLIAEDLASGTLVPAGDDSWRIAVEIRLYRPRDRATKIAEDFWAAAVAARD